MTDLKKLFAKKEKQEVSPDISPEEYRHIHVMQDDMDELSGKAPEKIQFQSSPGATASAGNPFLSEMTPQSTGTDVAEKKPVEAEATVPRKGFASSRKTVTIIVILLVAVGAGVSVYFLYGKMKLAQWADTTGTPVQESNQSEIISENVPPVPVVLPEKPFASSGANFLQLDTGSTATTSDEIINTLEDTAAKMIAMDTLEPVQFMVRDFNNNPIAFSRFSYLVGLKLPADLMASLDETFSLYFVRDGASVRRALVVQVVDKRKFDVAINKYETSLPKLFGALLYEKIEVISLKSVFKDGIFDSIQTRYTILHPDSTLSYDHVLTGTSWIMGTSKDSFRSVLGSVLNNVAN
jgi:hypothetical protein